MKTKIILISVLIFALLFCVGLWFAAHRTIVLNEAESIAGVRDSSYGQILIGKIKHQVNSFPLFFLMFKPFAENLDPLLWEKDTFDYNVRCRIVSVAAISLTGTLIFYYFAVNYSFLWGIYSVIIFITTFTVWLFFALARAYPVWILTTAIQALLFLHLVTKGYTNGRWNALAASHIALAMTHPFTLFYVSTISAWLWIFFKRDWKKYIFMWAVPAFLWAFYMYQFDQVDTYGKFIFSHPPHEIIFANFSKERILAFFVLCLFWVFGSKITEQTSQQKILIQEIRGFAALGSMLLFATFIIILVFKIHPGDPNPDDIPVFALHYITFLTPIGVIIMTYGSYFLMKFFDNHWMKAPIALCLTAVIVMRFKIEWAHLVDMMPLKVSYLAFPF